MSACVNDTDGDGDCAACARNPEAPCRWSVRERVLRFAEENHSGLDPWTDPETGFFVDDPQAHLGQLLDAYARELAERIRMGWDETRGATQASKVMAFAADLIDPGASNSG
jgi:hypothetical protein